MTGRLLLFLEKLRASYWFIPTLMLSGSGTLAFLLVALDRKVDDQTLRGLWWIYTGGPQGARAVLSTVSGSVITVAGTTFSITVAVLSMTSSQFGPRLLRGFLRDRANQFVLGTFVSTFLYCLLVLRVVRSVEEVAFVPHIAVTGGVLLALTSVGLLVFFVHHVSTSIQASQIIANVAHELDETIGRLYPNALRGAVCGESPVEARILPGAENDATWVLRACKSGYVQAIDTEALLALAERENGVLHLAYPPGEFVTLGNVLAMWRPASSEPDKNAAIREAITSQMEKRINSAFTLGKQRTATQDAGFLLLQLVEIATRALSPGINDPFTALLCLDRLGAALCHLATQEFPSVQHCDAKGAVRLVVQSPDFEALVYLTFTSIRCYGSSDPLVAARLLRVIGEVASHTSNGRRRDLLRNHLLWAYAAARTEAKSEAVQAVLENTYKNILHRFDTQIDTLSRKE